MPDFHHEIQELQNRLRLERVSELAVLRDRLAKLEQAQRRPRGRTNQAGAARYLGISEETLRKRHANGKGPRRARLGTRNWSYTYADLDAYTVPPADEQSADEQSAT